MMIFNPRLFMLASITVLSACSSTLNTQFSCHKVARGISGCPSLSVVDEKIDQGQWPTAKKPDPVASLPSAINHHYRSINDTDNNNQADDFVYRQPEAVNRIWIAPFEDIDGNYHYEQWIDVISAAGAWQPQPMRENHVLE